FDRVTLDNQQCTQWVALGQTTGDEQGAVLVQAFEEVNVSWANLCHFIVFWNVCVGYCVCGHGKYSFRNLCLRKSGAGNRTGFVSFPACGLASCRSPCRWQKTPRR